MREKLLSLKSRVSEFFAELPEFFKSALEAAGHEPLISGGGLVIATVMSLILDIKGDHEYIALVLMLGVVISLLGVAMGYQEMIIKGSDELIENQDKLIDEAVSSLNGIKYKVRHMELLHVERIVDHTTRLESILSRLQSGQHGHASLAIENLITENKSLLTKINNNPVVETEVRQ